MINEENGWVIVKQCDAVSCRRFALDRDYRERPCPHFQPTRLGALRPKCQGFVHPVNRPDVLAAFRLAGVEALTVPSDRAWSEDALPEAFDARWTITGLPYERGWSGRK